MESNMVVSNGGESAEQPYEEGIYSYGHIDFRNLEECNPTGFQDVVNVFRGVGDNIFQRITDQVWEYSGTYIQMVIVATDPREFSAIVDYLNKHGPNSGRKLFGYVVEKDHIHVLHSCPFSSRECKCRWRREIPRGKWRFKRSEGKSPRIYWGKTAFKDWGLSDWLYVFIYFFFRKRGERGGKQAWIDGSDKGLLCGRKYLFILL